MDSAFFTVDCINALNETQIKFIMPCVANDRVQEAVDKLGKTGKPAKFPILNALGASHVHDGRVQECQGRAYRVCYEHFRMECQMFCKEDTKGVPQEVANRNDVSPWD